MIDIHIYLCFSCIWQHCFCLTILDICDVNILSLINFLSTHIMIWSSWNILILLSRVPDYYTTLYLQYIVAHYLDFIQLWSMYFVNFQFWNGSKFWNFRLEKSISQRSIIKCLTHANILAYFAPESMMIFLHNIDDRCQCYKNISSSLLQRPNKLDRFTLASFPIHVE
jgi:hypothetical protein